MSSYMTVGQLRQVLSGLPKENETNINRISVDVNTANFDTDGVIYEYKETKEAKKR